MYYGWHWHKTHAITYNTALCTPAMQPLLTTLHYAHQPMQPLLTTLHYAHQPCSHYLQHVLHYVFSKRVIDLYMYNVNISSTNNAVYNTVEPLYCGHHWDSLNCPDFRSRCPYFRGTLHIVLYTIVAFGTMKNVLI